MWRTSGLIPPEERTQGIERRESSWTECFSLYRTSNELDNEITLFMKKPQTIEFN